MEQEKNPKCSFCDGSAGQIGFCCFPSDGGNVGCPAEIRRNLRDKGYTKGYYCVHRIADDIFIDETQISEGRK